MRSDKILLGITNETITSILDIIGDEPIPDTFTLQILADNVSIMACFNVLDKNHGVGCKLESKEEADYVMEALKTQLSIL